jgi:hypothetical protein
VKEYCTETRSREISYIQQEEGRLNGLLKSCLLKQDTEEKIDEKIKVAERRRKRRKQLLEDVNEPRRYWKWKEEALYRTVWGTGCGRVYGNVVRLWNE